ncbi:MAG: hypothetical protein ACP5MW_02580, partial [Thermoplasmata archaeon]
MDVPIYSQPDIFNELTSNFRECFGEVRQFKHFKEIVSAFSLTSRKSVAYLNSMILGHANQ